MSTLQIISSLTRLEGDLAGHDPACGEGELYLDEAADAVVQLDADIARVLEDPVLHVGVGDGVAEEVLAADAEPDLRLGEHLKKKLEIMNVVKEDWRWNVFGGEDVGEAQYRIVYYGYKTTDYHLILYFLGILKTNRLEAKFVLVCYIVLNSKFGLPQLTKSSGKIFLYVQQVRFAYKN